MKHFSQFVTQMHAALGGLTHVGRPDEMESAVWQPLADVYEKGDSLVIIVELPGVDKDKISVTAQDNVLRIEGVRYKRFPESCSHVRLMEIPYGRFLRRVSLPAGVDSGRIEAAYENGYLSIHVPWSAGG